MWATIHLLFSEETQLWGLTYIFSYYKIDKMRRKFQTLNSIFLKNSIERTIGSVINASNWIHTVAHTDNTLWWPMFMWEMILQKGCGLTNNYINQNFTFHQLVGRNLKQSRNRICWRLRFDHVFFQTEWKLNVICEFHLIINEIQSIFLSKKISLLKSAKNWRFCFTFLTLWMWMRIFRFSVCMGITFAK